MHEHKFEYIVKGVKQGLCAAFKNHRKLTSCSLI